MKSKVIIFSVLLFCSKFVGSTPHSEDLVRQRAHPLSDWQVNQNVQNDQYLDTDFTQTRNKNTLRNSAIQQETTRNIYGNEGKHNYDSDGYDKNPASLPSEKELLVNLDSTTDKRRLDSYVPRMESYALRTSQVGSDNQQYRNQNWRSLNQYANSAPSTVLIPDSKRTLVTIQEPYRGPVQHLQPKYIPSANRRYHQEDELAWIPKREQFKYPVADNSGDNKYVVNVPPRFGTSGPVPYDNNSEKQATTTEIKASPTRSQRYGHNFEPRSGIIYNKVPAVVATDTLAEQFENIKYDSGDNNYVVNSPPRFRSSDSVPYDNYSEEQATPSEIKTRPIGSRRYVQNFEPRSGIIYNKAPAVVGTDTLANQFENIKYINNYRSRSDLSKTAPVTNYDDGSPVITAPVNTKNEAPVDITEYLSEKPLRRRYANYRSDTGWSNNAHEDSYNVAPVITENVEESEKYEPNYGLKKYVRAPPARTNTVLVNAANNQYEDSNVPQYELNSPTPLKSNPSQDVYHLSSGIKEYNLHSNKNLLSATKKRYIVVIHPNGTVEYVDRQNIDSHQNSKIRLVAGDGVLAPLAKTPVPVEEYLLPKNKQPAGEIYSNRYPQFEDYPTDRSNVKRLPVYTKQSADDNISKTLLPFVNESVDDKNFKPFSQDVNQRDDDAYSKWLPQHLRRQILKPKHSYTNLPGHDKDLKSLPPYEKPAAHPYKLKDLNMHQSADDDNLNPVSSFRNEPKDYDNLEQLTLFRNQPGADKNSELFPPYVNEAIYHNKPKHSYNVPADKANSTPLLLDENQSDDEKPLTLHENNPINNKKIKPKRAYETQQASDENNSLPSYKIQPEDNNSGPFMPYVNQPTHKNKSKSKHSHQPADDGDLKPLYVSQSSQKSPVYEVNLESSYENQTSDDKKPEPLPLYVSQPANDEVSKPLLSDENQPEDENNSEPLLLYVNQPTHRNKSKSKHSHQPADDGDLKPLPLYISQATHGKKSHVILPMHEVNLESSYENQTSDDKSLEPLPLYVSQPANNDESKPLSSDKNHPEDENDSKPLPAHDINKLTLKHSEESADYSETLRSYENQSEDDINPKPLPLRVNQPTHHNKSKHLLIHNPIDDEYLKPIPQYVRQSANDEKSNLLPPSDENQPKDVVSSEPLLPYTNEPTHHNNSNPKQSLDVSVDDVNSKPLPLYLSQPVKDDKSKPLPSHENQPEDDNDLNPLRTFENSTAHDVKTKSNRSHESKPADDDNLKSLLLDEDDDELKPMRPYENQPADDFHPMKTPLVASESDDLSTLSTLTLTALDYSTSPKPKITEMYTPDVTTTPCLNDTSEDQIITLSPIEQATDNVSDVPPVATTTITGPVEIPDKVDTIKDASNKQDDAQKKSSSEDIASVLDNVQTYSITTISRSNLALLTDINNEKTVIKTVVDQSNQTNDKIEANQVDNGKNGTQTAMYNSSELLGTSTDGLAECDDYSPVTTSTSVQNDVNTGDNSVDLEQPETDVIITVSSSTANDTEDDIVTINIEVSESTDDTDSDEKTLTASIDTKKDSDCDCKEHHNNNGCRGENVETDLENLKGDPTMWIRTTDQDLIDKLIDENEKEVDVIYFFEIKNEPIIEREKETTKFCNGTVLIETKEITYAHKDDLSPTIVTTSKIIQIEDYEP